ncbi:hypothetical protein V1286_004334 [Bradyrhizobium algeriense]|uniref:Uncharacterized protein n=1 Tax=Bradyrhizobium algeriense TaxID=634784 RepID=A0ABU8BEA2_9BRAD
MDDRQRLARPGGRRCKARRRGRMPWRRMLLLGIVGPLARRCRAMAQFPSLAMRVEAMRIEPIPVACGRGIARRYLSPFPHAVASRMVGFAAQEWVARCTAPGLKWTAQRVDRMGASWRDQTSHIPLRMRLCLLSINGCRWNCQFFPLYFTNNCGCRIGGIQAACADFRSTSAAILRSWTKRRYSRALASASGNRNR